MIKVAKYECKYCHKQYVREDAYMKHECKQMKRAAEIQTIEGQNAYSHYSLWMKLNKRKVPTIEVFTTSKFYTNFINFEHYVNSVNLPDVNSFIGLMVEREIAPSLWTHDKSYVLYIEYFDRKVGPIRQAHTTVNTIFKLANVLECSQSEVFEQIKIEELILLIRQRRLSPWILLNSNKFKAKFSTASPEQRQIIEGLVRPMFWKLKFDNNPQFVEKMKECVEQMEI